ncbi:microtubule binding motor protein [Lithospermum erythrorhizon]|uniref:Microtubule binding motor protein n=1 Tax=Lithospermum erythrorhizon TaxID=34254 RepID=A0AAV3RAZ9_LITER
MDRRGGPITPKSSEKGGRNLRSAEGNGSGKHIDKEKGVNIQVIVRCRPLNDEEKRLNTPVVISCNEGRREVTAVQTIANKQTDRTFVFDKVFGPNSQQKDLYDQSLWPIVFEVLEGFNCTIFAYGQTGTGKTYTMEGGARKKNGEYPSDAGVIPRAVQQIFTILESQQAEYNMKVMFLELYNEEITDLLGPDEAPKFVEDKSKKPIALMEDGKGGVLVRGLEEEIVSSANEIYNVLEKGSAKRRTAETLLNKQSSRSHSIFSITIHIKEVTPEGEEMIKCGKLNLVDLAGSENVSRSGAREGRAREAGEINKSLLTLGRVINTLVDHSGHIPYRDSKLTRLLRDSLGGKTKTCIIATVSPSIQCLEETLNTLDYAHRAKNIKNKPEINQKMMKSEVMKDLFFEIERLKLEVYAAREKNGIYIPKDRYLQEEVEKKAMAEKIERMELDLESRDKKLVEIDKLYNSEQLLTAELTNKLNRTEKKLGETEHVLADVQEKYLQANAIIKEKEYLIANLLKSEKTLLERAFELRTELENAASDASNLFSKIERKDKIEDGNRILVRKFQGQLTRQLEMLHKNLEASATQQEQQLKEMEDDMQNFVYTKTGATEELRTQLGRLKDMYGTGIKALDDLARKLDVNAKSTFGVVNSEVSKHSSALEELFKHIASEADTLLNDLQNLLHNQDEKLTDFAQQQRKAHLRAITASRSISQITTKFFNTSDVHASKLNQIVDESQKSNDHKLTELGKKFEECAAVEEKQLLEKVAQLLANSNARKKALVRVAIKDLREGASSTTSKLQGEMSSMQNSTSCVKTEWTAFMGNAESDYQEDTAFVESGKQEIKDAIDNCMQKVNVSVQHWSKAEESLLSLEGNSVALLNEIVRGGMVANENLCTQFSSSVSSALNDADVASKNLLSSFDRTLQLDYDACGNLHSIIVPCRGELGELKSGHQNKIVEITQDAGKCLLEEYMVDQPSCSTPRQAPYNLPSVTSIEELKTPAFEDLLKCFWDSKQVKHPNGDTKQTVDSRAPLTAIN